MKTRNGFVSNSSSSSFVIITTKKTYDKAKTKETTLAANIIENNPDVCHHYHVNNEHLLFISMWLGDNSNHPFYDFVSKYNSTVKPIKKSKCYCGFKFKNEKYCPNCGEVSSEKGDLLSEFELECQFKCFFENLKNLNDKNTITKRENT